MAEQKVLRGSTQAVHTYPRVTAGGVPVAGVPSSATVRIGTPASSMPASGDAATIDSLSTTTSAAASEGDTSLSVASATWVRGRSYVLTTADGEVFPIEVRTNGTATSIDLAEPLPCAVASGATIQGWHLSIALTSAQTETAGECLAMWQATVGGVVYAWSQSFRIVRRFAQPTLTPTALTQAWPAVRQLRSRQDTDLEEVIRAAWDHRVVPLLQDKGIAEEDVVSVDALEPLHALGCVLQLALANPSVAPDVFERIEKRWDRLVEGTFSRSDWYEAPQTETPSPRPTEPPVVRSTRLVR